MGKDDEIAAGGNAPPSSAYQAGALLLSYAARKAEGTGLEPAHPFKDWLFSRQLPLDLLFSA